MSEAYINAAYRGQMAKLTSTSNGSRNEILFKVAARLFGFVKAGALNQDEIERELWTTASAIGMTNQEIKDTLRSAYKRCDTAIIPSAKPRPAAAAPTKRGYADLTEYAQAHYTPASAFIAAGWSTELTTRRNRPALTFTTATGGRWRFLDSKGQPFDSPKGYVSCWYLLDQAITIARATDAPLVICNGEPSAIVAQHYGVPAICVTGGSERRIPDALLEALRAVWNGPIVIALDCDGKGREGMAAQLAQLGDAGLVARTVHLNGSKGFDLADFCGLHGDSALADLLVLPPAPVPEIQDPIAQRHTDLGNAQRLVELHGDKIRYVKEWGWLAWDGRRWQLDASGEVERCAKATAIHLYQDAANAPDHLKAGAAKHAIQSQSSGSLTAMMRLAQSERKVRKQTADFDAQDWLLTCTNGTIDLRSGELLPHDPADMLTKAIDVIYQPTAKAPAWLEFLDRIFASDQTLIDYVQRMIGYMLTGSTSAQCMFIAFGSGANGKSVLIDVIRALVGDYGRNADASTFTATQSDRVRSDLARLAGVRFVSTIELNEGRKLSESLIKQVTGGDMLTAAFKFENEFEFLPRFKLLMASNHKPIIRGTDHGIWRRIRLIPFNVTIPDNEQDPDMAEKLKRELPGILAWAVRGCMDYQEQGMHEPDSVKTATNAYRNDMDVIGQFMDECTVLNERATVPCAALYAAYAKWAKDGGEEPVNQRVFGGQMSERGIDRKHKWNGWVYVGCGMVDLLHPQEGSKPDDEPDPSDPSDPLSGTKLAKIENDSFMPKQDQMDQMDQVSTPEQQDPAYRVIPAPPIGVNERLAKEAQERTAFLERMQKRPNTRVLDGAELDFAGIDLPPYDNTPVTQDGDDYEEI